MAGGVQWYLVADYRWALGAVLLIFVIPLTLIVLKPVNDRLLGEADLSEPETAQLLRQWGPRHWVRSIASGLSFLAYLWAGLSP